MKKNITTLMISATLIFFLVPQKSNPQNVLIDGNFSTTTSITPYYVDPPPLNMWLSWAGDGALFSSSVQNGVCSYFIDNPGPNMYDVQLTQYGFALTLNHRYRLSFDVKADADRDFGVFIGEFQGSWTNLNPSYLRHATSEWQTITIDLDVTGVFALNKLSFEMGIQKINMYFANISLIDLGPLPVVIVGTFQSELGCPGDWMPDCNNTALTYNSSTGLYSGAFSIPAGCHQYKVTNGSWAVNYGENGIASGANISLYVPVQTLITFSYNPGTHLVTTSPIASGFSTSCLPQVVLAGSFQDELGCGSDWDANCTNTALHYVPATGQFESNFNIPPGYYEFRTILNGDWAGNNFGAGGIPNGVNYVLSIPCQTTFHFAYNPITHVVKYQPAKTIVVAGSFQSELGCSGDWQPDCANSRLKEFNPSTGEWFDTLQIPAGHWEYKITVNNSWDENYGQGGQPGGANYLLDLCRSARVVFHYSECYHYVWPEVIFDQPNTVVIAGSFQSEVGCSGDWQANCDNTRMKYNPANNNWIDTLFIPAGHWEFKWTVNNSWDENYGADGQPNGPNISLDLCYPAKVVFTFYHYGCGAFGFTYVITNGICLNKFYDGNANNFPEPGEEPMGGITFTLTGNGITQTQTTGSDGKTAFTNLPDGWYVIKEAVPSGYYSSSADSQSIYLSGYNATVNFGNVCIGTGGAKGIGFWASKNGETALENSGKLEEALSVLRSYGLRNADGTDFDPTTYAQLRTWMMGANARNMTYMLSTQLAAMYLNTVVGFVDGYNSHVYTLGCIWWSNFISVKDLIWVTNIYLWYKTTADGKDPDRTYLECLKNAFEKANSNLTFAQPHPCTGSVTNVDKKQAQETSDIGTADEARIWPNPSTGHFTLRPSMNSINEAVQLKVYNVSGQQVYTATGPSNKDYRFGEKFKAGIYFVELTQGNNRNSFKVVKQ